MNSSQDDLLFAPELPDSEPIAAERPPWRVLVVDDDPQVHTVTLLALKDAQVEGRRLHIEHAYDGEQAKLKLLGREDWAVVLLDVVMTTDDEGLRLVHWLRYERGNHMTRVILRTGQPGVAPEREVMMNFDINDYQPKAELSAQRLMTAVVGGIRGWRDLRLIAEQRTGLEELLEERTQLLEAFRRFVPADELEALGHKTPLTAMPGDHVVKSMTLMFLDICSFTPMAERLGPRGTFAVLNRVFAEVVPLIGDHQGVVDKFLGDGMLAVFPYDPASAVHAAMAVLRRLAELNLAAGDPAEPGEKVSVGIGIHYGSTVLGLVGTEERIEPTVVADAVNVAARIERLTREFSVPIVISQAVYQRLPAELQARTAPLGPQPVRGKSQPVECWSIVA